MIAPMCWTVERYSKARFLLSEAEKPLVWQLRQAAHMRLLTLEYWLLRLHSYIAFARDFAPVARVLVFAIVSSR